MRNYRRVGVAAPADVARFAAEPAAPALVDAALNARSAALAANASNVRRVVRAEAAAIVRRDADVRPAAVRLF